MTAPVLQLDPLSMTIWMDPGGLGSNAAAADALMAAWSGGDFVGAVSDAASNEEEAVEAAFLGSWMWHEKRHFFDICITSYGAWRLRHMFVIGANAWAVAGEAAAAREPLVFPMSVYADDVRRKALGLGEPPANVRGIARDIRERKNMLATEGKAFQEGGRSLSIGGKAQLEGLAVVSQMHCLARRYGGNGAALIYERHVNKMDRFGLYRWIEAASLYLGCHRERADGVREIDQEFATAVLVAGLCGRWLGQSLQGLPTTDASGTKPSERMGRLILHFGQDAGHFGMTTAEAAERVDAAVRALWGRSVFEELDADLAGSARVGEALRAEFGGLGKICDAFDDYLALRARILARAKEEGPTGLSPRAFAATWADDLRPTLIGARPAGRWHGDGDGLTVHFGRRFEKPLAQSLAWAWREPDPNPASAIGLHATAAWSFILEQGAPLAKLAVAGRQHQLMLYPELERIIADLEGAGLTVRFAPGFEWPQPRDAAARMRAAREYAELTGASGFVCDLTGDRIGVAQAQLLTPWEFRRSPLFDRLREKLAGEFFDAEWKAATDWSDWIVRADLEA